MRSIGLVGLVLLAACVRLQWSRTRINEPIPDAVVDGLTEGTDLGRCLGVLGAPQRVWDDPRGVALMYSWLDEQGLGLTLSIPLEGLFNPPAFSYDSGRRRWRGVVLFFDHDLKLRYLRRGFLTAGDPLNS
ncbi:MAG: hypothetical protein ACYTEZ_19710 [Planctomycetota bacterium]|jgi:hypothetical protein